MLRHFLPNLTFKFVQPKFGKNGASLKLFNSCFISWFWLIKKQELFGVYKYKAQLRKTTPLLKKSIGLQEIAANTILHFQHSADGDI